jgi:hypothetical protein
MSTNKTVERASDAGASSERANQKSVNERELQPKISIERVSRLKELSVKEDERNNFASYL